MAAPPPPLSSSSTASITLTVKSLKPALSFTLAQCSPTATIAQLKAALHSEHGDKGAPAPDRQRWLLKGKAMADERLLREYEGVKDGDTVILSIKPAAAAAASGEAPATASAAAAPAPAVAPEKAKTAPAPSPFGFKSQSMAPLSPRGANGEDPDSKRARTTSSASLSASINGGKHARVPSITLTTDFSNFDNLSGSATSPIEETLSASGPLEGSHAHVGSPPFRPTSPGSPAGRNRAGSGASTPRSAPGTPAGLGSRSRGPSISIPIDLDNVEMMNPLSSDRKTPVGLSPVFLSTVKDPQMWTALLEFLDSQFDKHDPLVVRTPDEKTIEEAQNNKGDYREETKRTFETWLGSSKDYLTASDIARIRDQTGVWGMGGR